jgi:hypothetical protein
MPAGFETYTDTGALQASSDMFSLHLRKTGTATTITRTFGNTEASDLVVAKPAGYSSDAMCAVQIPGYSVGFVGYGNGGWCFASDAPVGTTANWFIFDKADQIPASNFGIETYDAAGKITFSSNFRPMCAVAALTSPAGVGSGTWVGKGYFSDANTITLAGKSLACMQGAPAGHAFGLGMTCWIGGVAQPGGPPEGQTCDYWTYNNNGKIHGGKVSADGATVDATTISWDDVTITSNDGTAPSWKIPMKLFVVDVTGVPMGATFF